MSVNLLSENDAGFEGGTHGWTLWSGSGPLSLSGVTTPGGSTLGDTWLRVAIPAEESGASIVGPPVLNVAGDATYFFGGVVYSDAAFDATLRIAWFTADGDFIRTDLSTPTTVPEESGGWSLGPLAVTSPSTATTARPSVLADNPTGAWYLDNFYFLGDEVVTPPPSPVAPGFAVITSEDNSTATVRFGADSFVTTTWPVRQSQYDVIGRPAPVILADVLGSRTGSFTLVTTTTDEAGSVRTLLTAGNALTFTSHADPTYVGMWFRATKLTETRIGKLGSAVRTFAVDFTEIDQPA